MAAWRNSCDERLAGALLPSVLEMLGLCSSTKARLAPVAQFVQVGNGAQEARGAFDRAGHEFQVPTSTAGCEFGQRIEFCDASFPSSAGDRRGDWGCPPGARERLERSFWTSTWTGEALKQQPCRPSEWGPCAGQSRCGITLRSTDLPVLLLQVRSQ